MANIIEVTPKLRAEFEEWLASEPRPAIVLENARKFPPWKLFRNEGANVQRVHVIAYSDDGTLWVRVSSTFNFLVMGERDVFGILPDDLVECDLPLPNEIVGDFTAPSMFAP